MNKTSPWVAVVTVAAIAAFAPAGAIAQTAPIQSWQPKHEERDPGKRIPPPQPVESVPAVTLQGQGQAPTPRPTPTPATVDEQVAYEAYVPPVAGDPPNRGGFFLGAQGGKGWVYEDVDQSALMVNAGYRWQAGPVALIGVELAAGKLDDTREDGIDYAALDYAALGANARFNFGRHSRVFGLVRAGYWSAEVADVDERTDGGYFGAGIGVDFTRNFNMSLVYTHHVYFENLYWDDDGLFYDLNRADTLMLGVEARF